MENTAKRQEMYVLMLRSSKKVLKRSKIGQEIQKQKFAKTLKEKI